MKRLKIEEETDKTKSMDFGMGNHSRMASIGGEKDSRSRRQMSMDLDTVLTPYLMPGGAQSTHTINSLDERYGRVPLSPRMMDRDRDSSVYTRSIGPDSPDGSHMETGLLGGASRIATSTPPPPRSAARNLTNGPIPQIKLPSPPPRAKSPESRGNPQRAPQMGKSGSNPGNTSPFADPSNSQAPQIGVTRPISDDPSEYGDMGFRFSNASVDVTPAPEQPQRKSLAPGAVDNRRLSMGFRPLPPDANPDDTAEERAMRIRSFYKEYFSADETAGSAPPIPQAPTRFQDEYSKQFAAPSGFDDSVPVLDSKTGRFVMPGSKPFAEPPARRAMTPPPRMPPRFMGPGSNPGSRAGSAAGGRFIPGGEPRSFSSASNHNQAPRRPIEPPKPLNLMPTPGKLTEDAFASPHMFAPAVRIVRDESSDANNRLGGVRPYSPAVAPHVPLASAFEELPVMPSPHMLRKSTAFTALDFAPPKKFKNEGDMSDSGSIHSQGSGISGMHAQNIRNGAYRVSRIPLEVVPMKDNMTADLKPTWDLGYGKSG